MEPVLLIIGGISAGIFLGVQAWLSRSGRKISERFDFLYQGFGLGLIVAKRHRARSSQYLALNLVRARKSARG